MLEMENSQQATTTAARRVPDVPGTGAISISGDEEDDDEVFEDAREDESPVEEDPETRPTPTTAPQTPTDPTIPAIPTPTTTNGADDRSPAQKRKRPVDAEAAATAAEVDGDGDEDEEDARLLRGDHPEDYAPRYSAAQVGVKMKRARLEARIAAEEELTGLRRALLAKDQAIAAHEATQRALEHRLGVLQGRLEEIAELHKRTIHGMRDNLQIETLVAALEKEKGVREAVEGKLGHQNQDLVAARREIQKLEERVAGYQKTETVLAQSMSHFQHRYASKDQQRAAQLEGLRRELEAKHELEVRRLQEEMELVRQGSDKLHAELSSLRKEHVELQASAQGVLEVQERAEGVEKALREQIAQLETDKAVLASKTEQIQKADAQFRAKIQAQEEQIATLTEQNTTLKAENAELTSIASDLMDMAEKQQVERQRLLQVNDTAGEEALARTRTRLRQSLG